MNTAQLLTTMPYKHRQATLEDAKAIAPLMAAFAEERESAVVRSLVLTDCHYWAGKMPAQ